MLYAEKFRIQNIFPASRAIGAAGLNIFLLRTAAPAKVLGHPKGNTSETSIHVTFTQLRKQTPPSLCLWVWGALPAIVEVFRRHGKSHLPVAVIQNGSLPCSNVVTGTVADIVYLVQKAGVQPPNHRSGRSSRIAPFLDFVIIKLRCFLPTLQTNA